MVETVTSLTTIPPRPLSSAQQGLLTLRGTTRPHPYQKGHILFVPRTKPQLCLDLKLSDIVDMNQDETIVTPKGMGISETTISIKKEATVLKMEAVKIASIFS